MSSLALGVFNWAYVRHRVGHVLMWVLDLAYEGPQRDWQGKKSGLGDLFGKFRFHY